MIQYYITLIISFGLTILLGNISIDAWQVTDTLTGNFYDLAVTNAVISTCMTIVFFGMCIFSIIRLLDKNNI